MDDRPLPEFDLTPPPFAEGLADWSQGDGAPHAPSYEACGHARVTRGDPDLGDCLELRLVEPVQRLRYMGELPLRGGARVELRARLKALRGPLPAARAAAWPGGIGGLKVDGAPTTGPLRRLPAHGAVIELVAVIAREGGPGVDLDWDERALYAHVGLDLVGEPGAVVRIADLQAREIPPGPGAADRRLAGFAPGCPDARETGPAPTR